MWIVWLVLDLQIQIVFLAQLLNFCTTASVFLHALTIFLLIWIHGSAHLAMPLAWLVLETLQQNAFHVRQQIFLFRLYFNARLLAPQQMHFLWSRRVLRFVHLVTPSAPLAPALAICSVSLVMEITFYKEQSAFRSVRWDFQITQTLMSAARVRVGAARALLCHQQLAFLV